MAKHHQHCWCCCLTMTHFFNLEKLAMHCLTTWCLMKWAHAHQRRDHHNRAFPCLFRLLYRGSTSVLRRTSFFKEFFPSKDFVLRSTFSLEECCPPKDFIILPLKLTTLRSPHGLNSLLLFLECFRFAPHLQLPLNFWSFTPLLVRSKWWLGLEASTTATSVLTQMLHLQLSVLI